MKHNFETWESQVCTLLISLDYLVVWFSAEEKGGLYLPPWDLLPPRASHALPVHSSSSSAGQWQGFLSGKGSLLPS